LTAADIKASHTAVAVDDFETVIDEICIRSCSTQAALLRDWLDGFRDDRTWAAALSSRAAQPFPMSGGLPTSLKGGYGSSRDVLDGALRAS
jgi:hypothetical protein